MDLARRIWRGPVNKCLKHNELKEQCCRIVGRRASRNSRTTVPAQQDMSPFGGSFLLLMREPLHGRVADCA